jgi:predicted helicase
VHAVTNKRPTKAPNKTTKDRPRGRKATTAVPDLALFSRDVIIGGGRKEIADRDYQIDAVRSCGIGLRDGGRGQLISPCGTGKTVMCQRIAELLCAPGGVVVIACPSIALILQTLREWGLTNRDHVAIAVCGDDSAADDAVTVEDLPGSVTTNAEEVARWLHHPSDVAIRLIVTTHISAHVVGDALRRAGTVAELLIVDEAHRAAGLADKHTALVHHDEHLAARRRLYTTATPKVVGTRGDEEANSGKLGMDNEEIFGPVLFRYTFADAIAEGYLDDYRLVVMGVTRREILEHLRTLPREAVASLNSYTGLHTAMVQTVLARAAVDFGLRRV